MAEGNGVELLVNTRSRRGAEAFERVIAASRDAGLEYERIHQLTDTSELAKLL